MGGKWESIFQNLGSWKLFETIAKLTEHWYSESAKKLGADFSVLIRAESVLFRVFQVMYRTESELKQH